MALTDRGDEIIELYSDEEKEGKKMAAEVVELVKNVELYKAIAADFDLSPKEGTGSVDSLLTSCLHVIGLLIADQDSATHFDYDGLRQLQEYQSKCWKKRNLLKVLVSALAAFEAQAK